MGTVKEDTFVENLSKPWSLTLLDEAFQVVGEIKKLKNIQPNKLKIFVDLMRYSNVLIKRTAFWNEQESWCL